MFICDLFLLMIIHERDDYARVFEWIFLYRLG